MTDMVLLVCPECGRRQIISQWMYEMSIDTTVPTLLRVHPLTCNGGNPNFETHHDHEVIMELVKEVKQDDKTL